MTLLQLQDELARAIASHGPHTTVRVQVPGAWLESDDYPRASAECPIERVWTTVQGVVLLVVEEET